MTRDNVVLFRSQYERKIREYLEVMGVPFKYEPKTFPLVVEETGKAFCNNCSSNDIARETTYTPDFLFLETGIYMEAKGKFDARARKVAIAFTKQYPRLDYRILLQRDNWMTSKKVRRYSDWLTKHNIKFAVGKYPPPEWLSPSARGSSEPSSEASSAAVNSTARGNRRRRS